DGPITVWTALSPPGPGSESAAPRHCPFTTCFRVLTDTTRHSGAPTDLGDGLVAGGTSITGVPAPAPRGGDAGRHRWERDQRCPGGHALSSPWALVPHVLV